jgi:hypothetical protein
MAVAATAAEVAATEVAATVVAATVVAATAAEVAATAVAATAVALAQVGRAVVRAVAVLPLPPGRVARRAPPQGRSKLPGSLPRLRMQHLTPRTRSSNATVTGWVSSVHHLALLASEH